MLSDRSFYPNDHYAFRLCRYARVDRRPLDPPLVVLLRVWRYSPETGKEQEVDYEYYPFLRFYKAETSHSSDLLKGIADSRSTVYSGFVSCPQHSLSR